MRFPGTIESVKAPASKASSYRLTCEPTCAIGVTDFPSNGEHSLTRGRNTPGATCKLASTSKTALDLRSLFLRNGSFPVAPPKGFGRSRLGPWSWHPIDYRCWNLFPIHPVSRLTISDPLALALVFPTSWKLPSSAIISCPCQAGCRLHRSRSAWNRDPTDVGSTQCLGLWDSECAGPSASQAGDCHSGRQTP